jgi:hypothetical protein
MRCRTRNVLALLLAIGCLPAGARAQFPRPVVGAETGVYSEAYGISGHAARRPSQTTRIYASPTFQWMGLEVGTTLMWSTESELTAQSLNRYYLNPRWSWGQVHAGDYTPMLSRFTAQAVRIRGGGVELTPGKFRFAAAAGQAQSATDLTVFDAAPRRVIYAGLLGVGDPAGTFIELSALRALDDSVGTDTLSVAPQENVVAAIAAGFGLRRVRFKGEYSASLFSRDIRASELDSLSRPAAGADLFTPRLSSRLDDAWSAEARVSLARGGIAVQVEQVGPGFTSLGNPYLSNDRREARVAANARLLRGRLSTSGSVGLRRDNLASDKRGTTYRRTGSLVTTLVSGQRLVSSVSILVNGLTLTPPTLPPGTPDPGTLDSLRLRNVMLSWMTMQQLRLGAHTLALTVGAQHVVDDSPRFGGALDARSTSVNLDWTVATGGPLQFALRPGFQRFKSAGSDDAFASIGVSVARRLPASAWNANLSGTYTQLEVGGQWRQDASFGLRLSPRDQLTTQFRYTSVQGVAAPFTETLASMRVTHRW